MRRWAVMLAAGSVGLAATGCALLPTTHVVAFETPYYVDGPDQHAPPDGFLKRGTALFVARTEESYSEVHTKGGVHAWVWSPSLISPEEYRREEEAREADVELLHVQPDQ